MNKEQAKEYCKTMFRDILEADGINTKKPFNCLNPDHPDRHPSMSYDDKHYQAHCFSCDTKYDVFDYMKIKYNCQTFPEQLQKACDLLNINLDKPGAKERPISTPMPIKTEIKSDPKDYTDYFLQVHKDIQKTDYPAKRGLTATTIDNYNLGYDVKKQLLVIPTSDYSYNARSVNSHNFYKSPGESRALNGDKLLTEDSPLFITEGEIDALSFCELGVVGIGLGSANNTARFFEAIQTDLAQNQKPKHTLVIALDNDETGQKAAAALLADLKKIKIPAINFWEIEPIKKFIEAPTKLKDPNDFLVKAKDLFATAVKAATEAALEYDNIEAKEKLDHYNLEYNAANYLDSFVDSIANNLEPPTPTGFTKLDKVFGDGLFTGVYYIGAIPSLGKTTFVLQIADTVAATSDKDVLIFSLEMSKAELIAKSISRLTFTIAADNRQDPQRAAKTTRGIQYGYRYKNYNQNEQLLIKKALSTYRQMAKRIFIINAPLKGLTAEDIDNAIKKHISVTGRKPIVFIDYLQMITPGTDRQTDKQAIDTTVKKLKNTSVANDIPIVVISSLNRANYNTEANFAAFKESGGIDYGADCIIGLQLKGVGENDFNVDNAKAKNPREIEVKILKQRNDQSSGEIDFLFYPAFNYFKEY